jgi:hypothetical protein
MPRCKTKWRDTVTWKLRVKVTVILGIRVHIGFVILKFCVNLYLIFFDRHVANLQEFTLKVEHVFGMNTIYVLYTCCEF